eukprot:Gb_26036 [translate_table: standard]
MRLPWISATIRHRIPLDYLGELGPIEEENLTPPLSDTQHHVSIAVFYGCSSLCVCTRGYPVLRTAGNFTGSRGRGDGNDAKLLSNHLPVANLKGLLLFCNAMALQLHNYTSATPSNIFFSCSISNYFMASLQTHLCLVALRSLRSSTGGRLPSFSDVWL